MHAKTSVSEYSFTTEWQVWGLGPNTSIYTVGNSWSYNHGHSHVGNTLWKCTRSSSSKKGRAGLLRNTGDETLCIISNRHLHCERARNGSLIFFKNKKARGPRRLTAPPTPSLLSLLKHKIPWVIRHFADIMRCKYNKFIMIWLIMLG